MQESVYLTAAARAALLFQPCHETGRERENAPSVWLPQVNVEYSNGLYPSEHRRQPRKMAHAHHVPLTHHVPLELLKPC